MRRVLSALPLLMLLASLANAAPESDRTLEVASQANSANPSADQLSARILQSSRELQASPAFGKAFRDLDSRYQMALRAAQREVQSNFERNDRIKEAGPENGLVFYWGECVDPLQEPSAETESEADSYFRDALDPKVAELAHEEAVLRANLNAHRYPDELEEVVTQWRKVWLTFWTAQLLNEAGSLPASGQYLLSAEPVMGMYQHVGERINDRLASLSPKLPKLNDPAGCDGPGSNPALLRTDPKGGQLWVITEFRFLFCSELGLDPWDRNSCRYWLRAEPDGVIDISGTVMYYAVWPGRLPRKDRFLITPRGDGTKPTVYVFR